MVSGAVACGASEIDLSSQDQNLRRMAAGIGQAVLISEFQKIFTAKGIKIAQILLTHDVLDLKDKAKKIIQLIQGYLDMGVVPVINENDVIDLNSFGGNDFLGAKVAILFGAERFLILSTMAGSSFGIGGEETKMQAVDMVERENIKAMVVNGKTKNILLEALS